MKTKSCLLLLCTVFHFNVFSQHESELVRIEYDSIVTEIISGEYKLLIHQIKYNHSRISIYQNNKKFDEINLDKYTNGSVFSQYKIGYFNKENTKFYFGNIISVFEYNINNKAINQILPLASDPPNTTYRILDILPNNNTMLLLKGELLKRSKLLEYEVIQRKNNNGEPINRYSTKFVHAYLNLDTGYVDETTFYNGYYESQYEDKRIIYIKSIE